MSVSELKHVSDPVRRIEVFTGAGRRRSWLVEEKAAIVAESAEAGATVCAVARPDASAALYLAAGAARRGGGGVRPGGRGSAAGA